MSRQVASATRHHHEKCPVDQRIVGIELGIQEDYPLEPKDTRQPLQSQGQIVLARA
jgi:hypothetical protein